MQLKAHNFDVLTFYSYPTTVVYGINSYSELFEQSEGDKKVKRMFEGVLTVAEEAMNRKLFDNKIAFKIRHRQTGTILYVGYKDNTWRLGLGVNSEATGTDVWK